ncbi:MAG: IS3 family transposase [Acidobacteriota bacterium]
MDRGGLRGRSGEPRRPLGHRCYVYRRVTAEMPLQGIIVNRKRVLRVMREDNLQSPRRRKSVVTTDSCHSPGASRVRGSPRRSTRKGSRKRTCVLDIAGGANDGEESPDFQAGGWLGPVRQMCGNGGSLGRGREPAFGCLDERDAVGCRLCPGVKKSEPGSVAAPSTRSVLAGAPR